MTEGPPELTDEQQAVVRASPADKLLVTAGAGTGKTHVLTRRIAQLVEAHGLYPGSEILVLSFSRAATAEVSRRLREGGGAMAFSAAVTFDSFATQLLSQVDPEGSWTRESYDGRVRRATETIESDLEATEFLAQYRHVLIDEIQDLVGPRAQFVMRILEHTTGGLTLFGDPAQSIYGHQSGSGKDATRNQELYAFIRSRFAETLQEQVFTTNFRATDKWPKAVLPFGPRLADPAANHDMILGELETLCLKLTTLGNLDGAAAGFGRENAPSTAILCRSNAQALLVSEKLHHLGVAHSLRREATDRAIAPWIAKALRGVEGRMVGRARLLELLEKHGNGAAPSPESMWRAIKALDSRSGDDVDIHRVAGRIAAGALPVELEVRAGDALIVSSIHRAKGLEFDRVVVTEPQPPSDDGDIGEEARVLYVALTRARKELYVMNAPDTRGFYKHKAVAGRWVHSTYRGKRPMVDRIEIRTQDVHRRDPPGASVVTEDVAGIQDYLAGEVQRGDEVVLVREVDSGGVFAVKHERTVVGITTEQFCSDLTRLMGNSAATERIERITGLRVDAVETVAGNPESAKEHGLGNAGMWLGVRLAGLGRFDMTRTNSQ